MPTVRVLSGPAPDAEFPIRDGSTAGRDSSADIAIPSPGVSRRHARFSIDGEGVWVQDLGSVNGVLVNGTRVTRQRLRDGDQIGLSDVVLVYSSREVRPPTAKVELPKTAPVVLEDATPGEAYSFDASGLNATVVDLKLSPAEQLAALQKRLKLVLEMAQALATATQREELLGRIVEQLFHVFPHVERGFLLLGPSVEQLKPAIVRDRVPGAPRPPRISGTIARRVFEQKRAILSHDARRDERFANAASIANMELRAFMVAPVLYREQVYGFIQLEAKKPFEREDLNLLASLASSTAVFLKNHELFESVAREAKEREAIQSELRIASRIQAQLVPKESPQLPWLELAGRTRPAKEVGGDYFDYLRGPKDELYVVIGDVSGKGVPAGLVMVMARSILHSLVRTASDPRAIAIETNRLLKKDLKPGMFLSLLIGLCDEQWQSIRFAGCGHERPYVYRARTGAVEQLPLGGTVLGVVADNSKNVAQGDIVLEPGDQVLLYTDGVPEAMDASGRPYTPARLAATIAANGKLPPAELIAAVERDVARHAHGSEQHDDITMIAIRRR